MPNGMIFDLIEIKYCAMKKVLFIISAIIILSSCAANKEARTTRLEVKNEKKLAEQAIVKKAVESKRFIIKFDKLYLSYGGIIDLLPRANYIIIDGNKAIISAAYLGRQFDIRPIAGINMRGENKNYELVNNSEGGSYKINMKVRNSTNTINVFLSINKDGRCHASFSTLMIDNIHYRGFIVPIKENKVIPVENAPESILI